MGLKHRKIKSMLEEYSTVCIKNLNAKLGTNFNYEINWDAIPEEVERWNWEDDPLKLCFYNTYFLPIEKKFTEMFKDSMYKTEICKQVKTIAIQPGPSTIGEFDFVNGTFFIKNSLCVNQKDPNSLYHHSADTNIGKVIETKLN